MGKGRGGNKAQKGKGKLMLPKGIFVYEYLDAGKKYLTVATTVNEIPDDCGNVGIYKLVEKKVLRVTKELRPPQRKGANRGT